MTRSYLVQASVSECVAIHKSSCEGGRRGELLRNAHRWVSQEFGFLALRTCSLNRGLMGLFVSSIYAILSPLSPQMTQEILYTTLKFYHFVH